MKNAFYGRFHLYDAGFGSFQGGFNIENLEKDWKSQIFEVSHDIKNDEKIMF